MNYIHTMSSEFPSFNIARGKEVSLPVCAFASSLLLSKFDGFTSDFSFPQVNASVDCHRRVLPNKIYQNADEIATHHAVIEFRIGDRSVLKVDMTE